MAAILRMLLVPIVALLVATVALGQEEIEQPKLDYSYCRFDSTTIALMDEYIPRPIRHALTADGMHPRFVPLYVTAKDFSFESTGGLPTHKVLYANNGRTFSSLVVLKRQDDGTYTPTWTTQQVPPAPHVKLHAKDLNGDGRFDIIATSWGGEPIYQAMIAFEFNEEGQGRSLVSNERGPYEPRAAFGIGVAAIDTLGRDGRPALEIWQDDSTNVGKKFVRIVQQYSDSAGIFIPESIDTLAELPFWCRSRRIEGRGQEQE